MSETVPCSSGYRVGELLIVESDVCLRLPYIPGGEVEWRVLALVLGQFMLAALDLTMPSITLGWLPMAARWIHAWQMSGGVCGDSCRIISI